MSAPTRAQIAGGMATLVVGSAVVAGMFVLGAPSEERVFRLDERRVRDLGAIAGSVDVYWTRYQRLPESLDELRTRMGAAVSLNDPGAGAAYEYRVMEGEPAYELCATFERDSSSDERSSFDRFWSHRAGWQCFRRSPPKPR